MRERSPGETPANRVLAGDPQFGGERSCQLELMPLADVPPLDNLRADVPAGRGDDEVDAAGQERMRDAEGARAEVDPAGGRTRICP